MSVLSTPPLLTSRNLSALSPLLALSSHRSNRFLCIKPTDHFSHFLAFANSTWTSSASALLSYVACLLRATRTPTKKLGVLPFFCCWEAAIYHGPTRPAATPVSVKISHHNLRSRHHTCPSCPPLPSLFTSLCLLCSLSFSSSRHSHSSPTFALSLHTDGSLSWRVFLTTIASKLWKMASFTPILWFSCRLSFWFFAFITQLMYICLFVPICFSNFPCFCDKVDDRNNLKRKDLS